MPRGIIAAPRNGMQALTQALEARLSERLGGRFVRRSRVQSLSEITVHGNLVLCVPAGEASRLLASESPELSTALSQVSYSPLTTATLFVENTAFKKLPHGLGVLIPQAEHRKSLGILYNSSAFENRVVKPDVTSLTMMLDSSIEESQLANVIQAELSEVLHTKSPPLETFIRRWERAVPKYNAHLLKMWTLAEQTWCAVPGKILFGNYTGQVSIRGMAELAKRTFSCTD